MKRFVLLAVVPALLFAAAPAEALEMSLSAVQFPERKEVDLDFASRSGATAAVMKSQVTFRERQAQIVIAYNNMKPAILYGGDVTCYVLWAVSRDGGTENLGELVVRDNDAKLDFYTAKKDFALLVTAEPYYLVPRPSELALFYNRPSKNKKVPSNEFVFSGFARAPKHALESITNVRWDARTPLELLQARKAFELAEGRGAETHAPRLHREAKRALELTEDYASKGKDEKLLDHARRAVSLSNEAINVTVNRLESLALEKQVAERRSELASLERQASEAEGRARDAEAAVARAQAETERVRIEKAALMQEKAGLTEAMAELRRERERLAEGLEGALSKIAATQSSARGYVVSLPDILFDIDKATLKPEAQVVISELAGILHVMPELQVEVEGHTDSTGSESYNLKLSEERAESVRSFLGARGVALERVGARGYGMSQPVADNATEEGRRRNRRVDIVISDGS